MCSPICGLIFALLAQVCFATGDVPDPPMPALEGPQTNPLARIQLDTTIRFDTSSSQSQPIEPQAEVVEAAEVLPEPDTTISLEIPRKLPPVTAETPVSTETADSTPAIKPLENSHVSKTPPATTPHSRAAASLVGRLGSLETSLLADASDGGLDHFTLLETAMIASGVSDRATLNHYNAIRDRIVARLHASLDRRLPPRRQMEALFEFLHGTILTGGYAIECTDPRVVFDSGRFNCVSASVLFNDLAASIGLHAVGLETPGHMMSRILLADGTVDVETTCPGWFRLKHDPRNRTRAVTQQLGLDPTRGGSAPLREVTPIETAGMIYYNRGVELLAAKRYNEALIANAKALQFDPTNETVWGNLLATINNWAIAEGADHRHQRALELLRMGRRLDSTYETFVLNFIHVYYCIAEKLTREGKYSEAIARMDEAVRELPHRTEIRQLRDNAYRSWAVANMTRARYHEAFDIIGRYSSLADQRAQLAEPLVTQQVDRLVKAGHSDAAIQLLETSVHHVPQCQSLADRRAKLIVHLARADADKGEFEKAVARLSHGAKGAKKSNQIVRRELGNMYNRWVQSLRRSGRLIKARQVTMRAQQDPILKSPTKKSDKS